MKLILIYNANSGKISSISSTLHKIISPKTYNCNLCQLTHGFFTERQEWKDFVKNSKVKFEFLHLDEISHLRLQVSQFPVVYGNIDDKLFEVLSSNEINKLSSVEDLIFELRIKLSL